MSRAPRVLGIERGDIQHFRLLRFMRMLGPGIDAEIRELRPAEPPARHHALDRLLDDALRMLAIQNLLGRAVADAAGISRVPVIDLVLALVARQLHLVRIDDDDVIAHVHMRREGRLVLPAEPSCDDRGETAKHDAFRIDDDPFLLDLRRPGRVGSHVSFPWLALAKCRWRVSAAMYRLRTPSQLLFTRKLRINSMIYWRGT